MNAAALREVYQYCKLSKKAYALNAKDIDRLQEDSPYVLQKIVYNRRTNTEAGIFTSNSERVHALGLNDIWLSKVVIAFKGTDPHKSKDLKKDLDDDLELYNSSLGSFHKGFLNAWKSIEEYLERPWLVTDLNDRQPLFVGHSSGGAIASIGTYLMHFSYSPSAITFGAPRFGNNKVANFKNLGSEQLHFVDEHDPVPHLPPRKYLRFFKTGYANIGKQVKISSYMTEEDKTHGLIAHHRIDHYLERIKSAISNKQWTNYPG